MLIIVGSGRSGNTLLRRLLMENADIYIPPESYVLPSEVATSLKCPAIDWPTQVDLSLAKFEYQQEFDAYEINSLREFALLAKQWPKSQQTLGCLLSELYKWIAITKGFNVDFWGDKTPLNTLRLGLIKKLFPQAKYIYIERDGVDVCVSYLNAGLCDNLTKAAVRWKYSRRAWLNFKKSLPINNYIEIKYEGMVRDPEKTINEIINKLKLPSKNCRSRVLEKMGDVLLRDHHVNVAFAPNTKSINKGRNKISDHDKESIKKILNKELKDAGYSQL